MGAQNKVAWIAPVISFGLIGFGATFGLTLGSAYLVDSFGDASSSALTAMTTLKVCVALLDFRLREAILTRRTAELCFFQCELLGSRLDTDPYASVGFRHHRRHHVRSWRYHNSVGTPSFGTTKMLVNEMPLSQYVHFWQAFTLSY